MSKPTPKPPVNSDVLDLLRGSYEETLDATKHQDDKIGRLFTGVSFLTAAALATANLGSSRYLSHAFVEFGSAPVGVYALATYLILVVVCVMLLINSLATPLRVPGLARGRADSRVDYVGKDKLATSQIYFGEIAKVGLKEWERKWTANKADLKNELAQSLVKETHNLAARTQFKYARTTEAITIFNYALLFLGVTIILCSAAAGQDLESVSRLPYWTRWLMAGMFSLFFFMQLQGQVRYARQTVDELAGVRNIRQAFINYLLVLAASLWVLLLGSGEATRGAVRILIFVPLLVGCATLLFRTWNYAKDRASVPKLAWFGSVSAVGSALTLTGFVCQSTDYIGAPLGAASAAGLLTLFSLTLPSVALYRNRKHFEDPPRNAGQD